MALPMLRSKCPAVFLKVSIISIAVVLIELMSFEPTLVIVAARAPAVRDRLPFNDGWRFKNDDPPGIGDALSYAKTKDWLLPNGNELLDPAASKPIPPVGQSRPTTVYTQPSFDDSSWRVLDLPHDWGVEGGFNQDYPGETGKLQWWGVGWYRKHFFIPPQDANKRVYLDLDGAMSYAIVWLNGGYVGGWPYGYSSWRVDLTNFLRFGSENVLAIRLDNPKDSSRWYAGGGIYRNVWLEKTEQVHVAHWGVFISTPRVSKDTALVRIETNVLNNSEKPAVVDVSTKIFALDEDRVSGGVLAFAANPIGPSPISAGKNGRLVQYISVAQPKLWSIRSPIRYTAITTIRSNQQVVDTLETPFGIRTTLFTADRGFLLNGQHVSIQGVCLHHDLGALGTALNRSALERQLQILRDMGVNAIRTSHNPPAPELLELCDRMGFLVMDEAFDCWQEGKRPNDYHLLFSEWHEKDLRALVRRDRNHPSVVLWSIGNEIPEQKSSEGWQMALHLAGIVHSDDPTRPVTAGCNSARAALNSFQLALDVSGFNYQPRGYFTFRNVAPLQSIIATESASTLSSRGEYFFPINNPAAHAFANFQVSSYDLSAWAVPAELAFEGLDRAPFVAGEFVWTGFDYLGEPEPYSKDSSTPLNINDPALSDRTTQELKQFGKIRVPSRSSYFGILDLAGFKKDRYYLYQSRWRPDLPIAHILPHWNWPERIGQVTPVHVYTSGDEGELFLNGKSLGRKKRQPFEYRLRWDDVRYEPGRLNVIVYKNGRKWAEDEMKTTGPPNKVTLMSDHASLRANAHDLAFITVRLTDREGALVPRSNNRVSFEIKGAGEIVATDNGDATNFESFQATERAAYNGLILVIVRPKQNAVGTITLSAKSDRLEGTAITIKITP